MIRNNLTVSRGSGWTTGLILQAVGLAIGSRNPVILVDHTYGHVTSSAAFRSLMARVREVLKKLGLDDISVTAVTNCRGFRDHEIVSGLSGIEMGAVEMNAYIEYVGNPVICIKSYYRGIDYVRKP
ncbi:MAG: hypothetical protein [Caudoviricetes sp.]|nr:MAG: hypothetical protein [Caudoviricetes sp.]